MIVSEAFPDVVCSDGSSSADAAVSLSLFPLLRKLEVNDDFSLSNDGRSRRLSLLVVAVAAATAAAAMAATATTAKAAGTDNNQLKAATAAATAVTTTATTATMTVISATTTLRRRHRRSGYIKFWQETISKPLLAVRDRRRFDNLLPAESTPHTSTPHCGLLG